MTGALNGQAFFARVGSMLDFARQHDQLMLLCYLDLDGFKAVNDQHGHHVGDELLQLFSAGTARELRREDSFGRVGGDEFAIAMFVSTSDEAQELAESLYKRLATVLASSPHAVTCSMGGLIVPAGNHQECNELMRLADLLMYGVKHTGKNGVSIATAIPQKLVLCKSPAPLRQSPSVGQVARA